ncbi:MAG TPA: DUF481 domain-containing protein [Phycisphaerales bacterium]|nr:DUF481 domain-containing protein [Phycisphaerales bacterium]HMP36051.1 DUF481 domain-containing protein [Phycisphaerales bacterium]
MPSARHFATALIALAGAALAPASAAESIQLSNGDVLTVDIVDVGEDFVTFTHAVFGTVTVPRATVTFLSRPAAEAARAAQLETAVPPPAPPAADAPAAAPPPAAEIPAPPPREWKFRFTLAGSGTAGNTQDISVTTRLTALREVPTMRTFLEGTYFFGSSGGDKSDNKFSIAGRNDFLFPEKRYFFFVDSRFDYDEFNSWLYRLTGHVGVGYKLLVDEPFTLSALGGIGFNKEWKSVNDDIQLEGLLGAEGKWTIAPDNAIVFSSIWYPQLTDWPEYRWVNTAGWNWKFSNDSPLSLTAGIRHEYDSDVDPGQDHNDFRFFAGVDYEF